MKTWATLRHQGFTIVEILIVIVVIGILASVVIIGYLTIQGGAYDATVKADLTKISDTIHLKALDDDTVPLGGATNTLSGDPTVFPGVRAHPTDDSYDITVSNLYYCAGKIGSGSETRFGLIARSASQKAFQYLSGVGVSEMTASFAWPAVADGPAACTALGFVAPYTWSYGFNPDQEFLWYDWTLPDGNEV